MGFGVWTVLRSGGLYDPLWVDRLHRGVQRGWDVDFPLRFFCLSDENPCVSGVTWVPLRYNWPGWWSKIELWRHDIHANPGLYLDLDNVMVGPISHLLSRHGFGRGFKTMNDANRDGRIQSAVMRWSRDWMLTHGREIFSGMVANPARVMSEHPGGDQSYIESELDEWDLFAREHVLSYKRDVTESGAVPDEAVVVQFHGTPKPSALGLDHPLRKLWENDPLA